MKQNLSLKNQNILVTGVSRASGIGAAIAIKLANAGAKVVTHGNPNYDAERKYPDADQDFCSELAEAGRWGTPDDAAKLVHFLHSDYASWITGQTIASEGGFQR